MNRTETGKFISHDGKSEIFYTTVIPCDMPPHAVLQICHGMTEHTGRYADFAEYLASHGVVVCMHDHLGHGKSSREDDYGFFGEDGGIENLIEDVETLRSVMRKKYPSLPYVIFGHSMGSFIVREYLSAHADAVDGAVICGTSGGGSMIKAAETLARAVRRLRGPRHRSKFLERLMNGNFTKKFRGEGAYAWLTRDTEIQEKYARDPACTFTFTAAGYCDLFRMINEVNDDAWFSFFRPDLPVLLTAGEKDPVGENGEGVKKTAECLDDAGVCTVKLHLYPDCRHEILNELNRDEVYADILSFVDEVSDGVVKARTGKW